MQTPEQKCGLRNVRFVSGADFFQGPMLSYVEKTWEQWLTNIRDWNVSRHLPKACGALP